MTSFTVSWCHGVKLEAYVTPPSLSLLREFVKGSGCPLGALRCRPTFIKEASHITAGRGTGKDILTGTVSRHSFKAN
ncbi:MAG: hypothetical protein JHC26_08675 [Thermofilum sp.]|nr:hypothetical protein [Thermofilum sp.]